MVGGLRLVALAALVTLGSCCENPFLQIGSQCLFFGSSFSFDYTASADFCTALNGRLVTIDNTQKLRDIVDYTTNNLTQDYSYWVDGTNVQGTWLFADGTTIPQGTPYWATFSVNGSGYGQEPRESQQQGTNCLAIKHPTSFYFVSNDCSDSISPLCEQMTGLEEVGVLGAVNTGRMPSRENNLGTSNSLSTITCGGELSPFAGELSSPNYPNNYDKCDCIWTITTTTDSIIRITVIDFESTVSTSVGTQAHLEIRDGSISSSPELGYYYGKEVITPIFLVTSSNEAYIRFYSSYDHSSFRGFDLQWTTVCGDGAQENFNYNSPTGTVNSPCYPYYYPSNLKYTWQISVDEGYYVVLTVVSFDTGKDNDIAQIRDGASDDSPILSKLSGSIETGYEIVSSTNQLYISFTSDDIDFSNKGFAFIWIEKKLCPTPYLNVGQLCIHIVLNDLTFGMSSIACQEESGELASINDSQDLRDLYVFLQNQGIADTSFWLGGTDQEEEGLWKWKDGTLVPTGTPFWGTTGSQSEVQEPDGGEVENCLLLLAEGHHYFRDSACSSKAPALCMLSAQ